MAIRTNIGSPELSLFKPAPAFAGRIFGKIGFGIFGIQQFLATNIAVHDYFIFNFPFVPFEGMRTIGAGYTVGNS